MVLPQSCVFPGNREEFGRNSCFQQFPALITRECVVLQLDNYPRTTRRIEIYLRACNLSVSLVRVGSSGPGNDEKSLPFGFPLLARAPELGFQNRRCQTNAHDVRCPIPCSIFLTVTCPGLGRAPQNAPTSRTTTTTTQVPENFTFRWKHFLYILPKSSWVGTAMNISNEIIRPV